MIHELSDLRAGFEVSADAVVVGSGAGGAVAAANLTETGLRVVVLEAGPVVRPADMTRDGPRFMARYFWEGGLRMIGGSMQMPSMQARCLGGSTVVNSAIMFKLPDWVRDEWIRDEHLPGLRDAAFDRAFERIFERTRVQPTPLAVMGRRNRLVGEALAAAGLGGGPLPRAVQGCHGCADCTTGCHTGAKQSVDRSWLPGAVQGGAEVYTNATVDAVLTEGRRAVGVRGRVIDREGGEPAARFTVRAPRVLLAAGAMATPALLLRSGINPGKRVGATFYAHIGGAAAGYFDEPVEPWIGATQGWGAISPNIRGLKYESLWAPEPLILSRYGGLGRGLYDDLQKVRHMALIVSVYRARVRGRVKVRRSGTPVASMRVPDDEVATVMRGVKEAVDGLFAVGARGVSTSIWGMPAVFRSPAEVELLLTRRVRARDVPMTGNHIFGSCPMSADPRRGPTDPDGAVRGVDGLWLCDASVFPSPSAVNPQATVMALSDLITRRIADLEA